MKIICSIGHQYCPSICLASLNVHSYRRRRTLDRVLWNLVHKQYIPWGFFNMNFGRKEACVSLYIYVIINTRTVENKIGHIWLRCSILKCFSIHAVYGIMLKYCLVNGLDINCAWKSHFSPFSIRIHRIDGTQMGLLNHLFLFAHTPDRQFSTRYFILVQLPQCPSQIKCHK